MPFDLAAARAYAALMCGARAKGATIHSRWSDRGERDSERLDVATRDEAPLRGGAEDDKSLDGMTARTEFQRWMADGAAIRLSRANRRIRRRVGAPGLR